MTDDQTPLGTILLHSTVLLIVAFALYLPTRNYDFINLDDQKFVTENPRVQAGLNLNNIGWAFGSAYYDYWHPLPWLSHMLDCDMFGLWAGGHHLTSAAIHSLTALLLYLMLRRLTGATWRSFFVAAIFAVHPLRVESVAWVSERKDVLSGMLWVITIWFYARFAQRKSTADYLLSIVCFGLALMAKPMVVTLPAVLLLLDYWPLQRSASVGKLILEKIPFGLIAIAGAVATVVTQQAVGAIATYIPLEVRLLNALNSYFLYLVKFFWPTKLAIFYPYPRAFSPERITAAVLVLAGVSMLAIWQRRKRPYLLIGWLWFILTLLPVIGLLQAGSQARADRYTYIPHMGLALALVWSAGEIARRRARLAPVVATFGAAAIVALAVMTVLYVRHWKNSITVFQHAASVTENNHFAHNNAGTALADIGKNDLALAEFDAALKAEPKFPFAHSNRGRALSALGRKDEAIAEYLEAIRIDKNYAEPHNNLGRAYAAEGRDADAIAEYQAALKLDPNLAVAHYNWGNLLDRQGNPSGAAEHYRAALKINPQHVEAHNQLGMMLVHMGDHQAAMEEFSTAIKLRPNYPNAHYNLGLVLELSGRFAAAAKEYEQTLRIKPDHEKARAHLAQLRQQTGKP